jgi:hypothetical protein
VFAIAVGSAQTGALDDARKAIDVLKAIQVESDAGQGNVLGRTGRDSGRRRRRRFLALA